MFVRNAWYIAAWVWTKSPNAHSAGESSMEPIVLFRDSAGTVAALPPGIAAAIAARRYRSVKWSHAEFSVAITDWSLTPPANA